MNDKRSESTHPSARPPLPSIAPPTEDIDAEWGADDAPVPQVVAAPSREPEVAAPPAAAATPLPSTAPAAVTAAPEPAPVASPSYPPAPEPPPVRPSAPVPAAQPSAAAATPVVGNALRKQTLLGIAPVVPQRSEPPATVATQASDPPRPASAAPSQPAAAPALVIPAANPLRKQTLLGIAPVIPAGSVPPAAGEAQPSTLPAAAAAPSEPPGSPVEAQSTAAAAELAKPSEPPSIAASDLAQPPTAEAVTSDAPLIRDLKGARAPAARVEMSTSAVDLDLPALRPRRSRWVYIVGAAALLGGGVFALRQMDRAPAPLDESLARPIRPAAEAPAAAATPKADDDLDAEPEPAPSEPANPAPIDATPAADSAASAAAAASAAPSAGAAVVASPEETKRISIDSEPPGARMFWKGKEVGTTPFTLEIPAGARRSYELGKPGFVTRKVVIDGSKSEISIGLKPQG